MADFSALGEDYAFDNDVKVASFVALYSFGSCGIIGVAKIAEDLGCSFNGCYLPGGEKWFLLLLCPADGENCFKPSYILTVFYCFFSCYNY